VRTRFVRTYSALLSVAALVKMRLFLVAVAAVGGVLPMPQEGTAQRAHVAAPDAGVTLPLRSSNGGVTAQFSQNSEATSDGHPLLNAIVIVLSGPERWNSAVLVPLRLTGLGLSSSSPVEVAAAPALIEDDSPSTIPMFQQDAGLTVSQVARSPLSTDTVPAPSLAPHEGQESVSIALGGLTKDVEIELYGTSRTAAPGGLVMVRYSINSYEDTDERVRVRLHLPTGWTLLDRDIE
jgi:hypothetical protein